MLIKLILIIILIVLIVLLLLSIIIIITTTTPTTTMHFICSSSFSNFAFVFKSSYYFLAFQRVENSLDLVVCNYHLQAVYRTACFLILAPPPLPRGRSLIGWPLFSSPRPPILIGRRRS